MAVTLRRSNAIRRPRAPVRSSHKLKDAWYKTVSLEDAVPARAPFSSLNRHRHSQNVAATDGPSPIFAAIDKLMENVVPDMLAADQKRDADRVLMVFSPLASECVWW